MTGDLKSKGYLRRRCRWLLQTTALILVYAARVESFVGPSNQVKDNHELVQPDQKELRGIDKRNVDLETLERTESSRRDFLSLLAATGVVVAMPTSSDAKDIESPIVRNAVTTTVNSVDSLPSQSIADGNVAAAASGPAPIDWDAILKKASKKALGGGKAGASAAVVQVCSLMWLRTSMNYQYRYGGDLSTSLKTLWNEGGIPRLYQGLPFALVQGPLTRFGDTAANVGILALLETLPETQGLPLPLKTFFGSLTAGLWRIVVMPIDSSKTAMQVEGADGLKRLWEFVGKEGPAPLFQGSLATAAATAVGHFPWFLTYNFLNEQLPEISASDDLVLSLVRSAVLGLSASCVSDICSNSLRVIKTTKQTARLNSVSDDGDEKKEISYAEVVRLIIEKDGAVGLFGRGLQTRLLTNSLQGALFSVLWRYFQQAGGA